MCTDFKLQQQIQKERATNRKELGSFCQQFGFNKLTPPSKQHIQNTKKKFFPNKSRPYINHQTKTYYKKPTKVLHDKNPQNTTKPTPSQSLPRCYKCGRLGHTKNNCFAKQQLNELDLTDQIKQQLMHIFLNSSDEEENDQQNVHNLEIDDIDSQQDSQEDHDIQTDSQCIKTNCVCPPQINMVSKE